MAISSSPLDPAALLVSEEVAEAAISRARKLRSRGPGAIVFLPGEPGSGRSATLRSIDSRLRSLPDGPTVIAGGFSRQESGLYQAWHSPGGRVPLDHVVEALALGASVAVDELGPGTGTALRSAATFVKQVLETALAGIHANAVLRSIGEQRGAPARSLAHTIRERARQGPLVWIADDVDESYGGWWLDALRALADEIVRDLPVLVIASVASPAGGASSAAQELVAELGSMAECLPSRPRTGEELARWLGRADAAVVNELHALSGGVPGLVLEAWDEFQRMKLVERSETGGWSWRFAGGMGMNRFLDARIGQCLRTADPAQVREVRLWLGCGALQGRTFTIDAVAMVRGKDRDELMDVIDDHLLVEANPAGFLRQSGYELVPMPDGSEQSLWRYEFNSHLLWSAFRRYGLPPADEPQVASWLLNALRATFGFAENRFAHQLANVAAAAGQEADAAAYRASASRAAEADLLEWQVRDALANAEVEPSAWQRKRLIELLLKAGEQLNESRPPVPRLQLALYLYRLALEAGNLALQAKALDWSASAHLAGANYKGTIEIGRKASTAYHAVGDRRGESNMWNLLGIAADELGEMGRAKYYFLRALALECRTTTTPGTSFEVARAMHNLAAVEIRLAPVKAEKLLRQALVVFQHRKDARWEASCLHNLGEIAAVNRRLEEARKLFGDSIRKNPDGRRSPQMMRALVLLSDIEADLESYWPARQHAYEAFLLAKDVHDVATAGFSLLSMATAADAMGLSEAALRARVAGMVLLVQTEHGDMPKHGNETLARAAELGYVGERYDALLAEVVHAMHHDDFRSIIRAVMAPPVGGSTSPPPLPQVP